MSDTTDTAPSSTPEGTASGRKKGLSAMLLPELRELAGGLGIKSAGLRKGDLVEAIRAAQGGGNGGGNGGGRGKQPEAARAEATQPEGRQPEPQRSEPAQSEGSGDEGRGRQQGKQQRDQNNQNNQNAKQDKQKDQSGQGNRAQNNQQNNQNSNQQNNQNNQQGNDDEAGGSRRNRRRRGRERTTNQGGGAGGGSTAGSGSSAGRTRGEPDLQILEDDVLAPCAGILDLLDNYAFVRTSGYLPGPDDVYVSMSMVRKYGLRRGDAVTGQVRQPRDGERKEKYNPLVKIDSINGADPESAKTRVEFNALVPVHPTDRLRLETGPTDLTGRLIDLVAPVGKGQRGLVVSPARAGKTTIVRSLADSVTANNPEVHLMVVLVDERPEEVTDFERSVNGEVISSTFDRPPSDHTLVAELAIERAKRLVELGHDVVVLVDGLTRLGRAYNLAAPASGRILSGGVDSAALYPPKRFFGAARNIEDGGSLTILATALVESGSKTDEVIFEELESTGNMELRLRRELADKRLFPAVDAVASGTRHEELLLGEEELAIVWKLRRTLAGLDGQAALESLLLRLHRTQTNIEFLRQVQVSSAADD